MLDDDGPPPSMSDDNSFASGSTPGGADSGAGAGLGGMADLLSGMGGFGGGGGGGMPDMASIMNNPQLMAMAQQLAANGGLANIMQNPAVANMVFCCFHLFGHYSDSLSSDESDAIGR